MLDLPQHPVLDKHALVGGCSRLQTRADHHRLLAEMNALPAERWGGTGGRIGVHAVAQAIFLRGHAPAEGELPIDDRPALDDFPYARSLIRSLPGTPMRCLLAKLPAGAHIAPHVDKAPYFHKTIRLHIPIVTNPDVSMWSAGLRYRMQPGEIWALNNVAVHAVWNRHPSDARVHMICDYVPDQQMLNALRDADRSLGVAEAMPAQ